MILIPFLLNIKIVAIVAVDYLSKKYLPDEYLPGKAIALIDGAAAYCRMKGTGKVREKDIIVELEKNSQNMKAECQK